METYCTRPDCSQPINNFPELDNRSKLQTAQQKHCKSCGMPQILGGRYIPQKLLGKGGFGAAYLACDRYTPKLRKCVVKQFQPSDTFNEKTLKIAEELFTREAEVLETLGNENSQIPDLYAFFPLIVTEEEEEKQFFYIVQEFIDGQTLEEEVKEKGKLSEAEVVEILENMLSVLQFVHEHNSIHRDIKPSNIMRDQQGKLYLLDFGAVKRVTGASTANYSTGIYSMGFAPPEQMQGRQVYPSTDLYALAATCLRLLTGKPIQELYDSYNNTWAWRRDAQASEKVAKILDRMLLPTPKERYPSAQSVLMVLQADDSLPENEAINTEFPEASVMSQPSDWRSLLALSKEEEAEAEEESELSQREETAQRGNWQSLLSLSSEAEKEKATEEDLDLFEEYNTALQRDDFNSSVSRPPDSPENEPPPEQPSSSSEEEVEPLTPPNDPTPASPPPHSEKLSAPQPQPQKVARYSPQFQLWEMLASAGFTGLEGALFFIAFTSLFSNPAISIGLWGMTMGGLIYAVWKRFIEKINFLILGVITLGVVVLVPPLHNLPVLTVIIVSFVAGAGAIALTTLVRLFLILLSRR